MFEMMLPSYFALLMRNQAALLAILKITSNPYFSDNQIQQM